MGPLSDVKIIEIAGIGPGPFAAMVLADLGADVIRVDRPGGTAAFGPTDPTLRGRPVVEANLKTPEGRELVLALAEKADALIEGNRPGVMERLGLGPDELAARNPKLVYGRMTGYGQDGPLSSVAGHDINYISISGVLGAIARKGERPLFPINLAGDYGGGGMFLIVGVLAGILEARASGKGQVVDAAMTDGSALLTAMMYGMRAVGAWNDEPGTNLLDSGAHFYDTYTTKDGGHVALGAIEPQFYAELLRLLEIPAEEMPQFDQSRWGEFKGRIAGIIATKRTAEWAEILEPAEACATAIYGFGDAHEHPHNVARGTFIERGGVVQPAPAPRFSRTQNEIREAPSPEDALAAWGVAVPAAS
ncbi:MAG: CoA transferase [Solirubrobacteraceae bacterium]|nr:CoA transferase [Solirubrobacteraceae bacterium]